MRDYPARAQRLVDRRDFNADELEMIRNGKRAEAKVAWHERKAREAIDG